MEQWLLSVAGIAVLSVLCDVVLPTGQTKKYIKTVIGIVVTLAIVQPLFALFGQGVDGIFENTEITAQQQYLDYVSQTQEEEISVLKSALEKAGFSRVTVSFNAKTRRYVAMLNCRYTDDSYLAAHNAASSANCRFSVEFKWNNSE